MHLVRFDFVEGDAQKPATKFVGYAGAKHRFAPTCNASPLNPFGLRHSIFSPTAPFRPASPGVPYPLSPAPLLALLAFFPSPSSRPLFHAKHLRSASLLAPLREENRGFLRGPPFSGVSSSICNEPCASSCAVSTASELFQRAVPASCAAGRAGDRGCESGSGRGPQGRRGEGRWAAFNVVDRIFFRFMTRSSFKPLKQIENK